LKEYSGQFLAPVVVPPDGQTKPSTGESCMGSTAGLDTQRRNNFLSLPESGLIFFGH